MDHDLIETPANFKFSKKTWPTRLSFFKTKSLKKELNIHVNHLIYNHNIEEILFLIKNGFVLNKTHALNLINNDITDAHLLSLVIEIFNLELKKEFYKDLIIIDKSLDNKLFNKFWNKIEKVKNNTFIINFILKHNIFSSMPYKEINFLHLTLKSIKEKTPCYMYESYNKSHTDAFKISCANALKHIEESFPELNHSYKENTILKYSNILEPKSNLKPICINEEDKQKLPNVAQNCINDIYLIYNQIKPDKLHFKAKLELKNLYKKIPQLIESYIVLSSSYKNSIDNAHPDFLLIESLEKIKDRINHIYIEFQDSQHRELKIINTYLNNI